MVFCNYASAHANNSNGIDFAQATADDLAGPGVGVGVKFGRPKLDCAKLGVCEFKVTFELKLQLSRGAQPDNNGLGTLTMVDDKLQLEVYKASLTNTTDEKHFGSGQFTIVDAISLPEDVVDELGQGYTIQPGDYGIEETEDRYVIVF